MAKTCWEKASKKLGFLGKNVTILNGSERLSGRAKIIMCGCFKRLKALTPLVYSTDVGSIFFNTNMKAGYGQVPGTDNIWMNMSDATRMNGQNLKFYEEFIWNW